MVHESLSSEFVELKDRLAALERRFNPEGSNLHFGVQKASMVWPDLWEEIDEMVREGLKKVDEHHDYFIEHGMYDDGMYWYDLFLLIHGAGISHAVSEDPSVPIDLETQRSILSCLLEMTEYTVIIPADICSHNYEALAAFLFAFPGLIPEADSFSNDVSDDFRRRLIEGAAKYALNRAES